MLFLLHEFIEARGFLELRCRARGGRGHWPHRWEAHPAFSPIHYMDKF